MSSNGILESNTPRVTHCFKRPLRGTGAGVCAESARLRGGGGQAGDEISALHERIIQEGRPRCFRSFPLAYFLSNDTPERFFPFGRFPFNVLPKGRIDQGLLAGFTARPIGDCTFLLDRNLLAAILPQPGVASIADEDGLNRRGFLHCMRWSAAFRSCAG